MKKFAYIACFILFGFLLQLLLHAVLELWYFNLLLSDFDRYNLGFTWEEWATINNSFHVILLVIGIFAGYIQGTTWWQRIYEPIPHPNLQKKYSVDYP